MDLTTNFTGPSPDSNICINVRLELEVVKDPFYREPNTRVFVTVLYTSVACIGAIGNFFVIAAVVRNPQMRTPRNYFIINLALSDLFMCVLAVPFTLYYVLNTFWDLGSTACKIVASAQGVNIFVSAMSITAIGLDRYWVILFPTKTQQQRFVVVVCFTFIWIFSSLLAFPLFYATDTQFPPVLEQVASCGVYLLVCSESWDKMVFDKRAYTISSTAFQYVLPLTMLTFVYARIIWRLENRVVYRQRAMTARIEQTFLAAAAGGASNANGGSTSALNSTANANATIASMASSRLYNRRRSLETRQRRMNLLLICVVAFFAFCWLPLNVYNALLSFDLAVYNVVAFSSCHVFGMMSACANPVLYGVFNENFRQEFVAMLTWLRVIPIVRYLAKFSWRSATGGGGGGGGRRNRRGSNVAVAVAAPPNTDAAATSTVVNGSCAGGGGVTQNGGDIGNSTILMTAAAAATTTKRRSSKLRIPRPGGNGKHNRSSSGSSTKNRAGAGRSEDFQKLLDAPPPPSSLVINNGYYCYSSSSYNAASPTLTTGITTNFCPSPTPFATAAAAAATTPHESSAAVIVGEIERDRESPAAAMIDDHHRFPMIDRDAAVSIPAGNSGGGGTESSPGESTPLVGGADHRRRASSSKIDDRTFLRTYALITDL